MSAARPRAERVFAALGTWVVGHRLAILGAFAALIAPFAWKLPDLGIATSIETLYRTRNAAIADYQAFRDRFGRDEKIVLVIGARNVFDVEFLRTLKQFHHDLEQTVPLLVGVDSLVDAPWIDTAADGSARVRPFLAELPRSEDEARAVRRRAIGYPPYAGRYLTEDRNHLVVVVETRSESALDEAGVRLSAAARGLGGKPPHGAARHSITQVENIAALDLIDAVVREYDNPAFHIELSGTPVYQSLVEPMVRANAERTSALVLVASMAFMALLFRRMSGVFVPLLVVLGALTVALGAMSWLAIPLTLTSSMLPAILLSIGLTAPIHFLVVFFKYQRRVGKRRAVIATLAHSGLPITMTTLTTAAGLASFAFSDIAPVAHLGTFAALGMMAALAITLIAVPALLALLQVVPGSLRADREYESSLFNRGLVGLGAAAVEHPWAVIVPFAALTIAALVGVSRLEVSHDMLHYFAPDSPFMTATESVEEATGGFRALEIVVDSGRAGGALAPALVGRLARLERGLPARRDADDEPYVGTVRSLAGKYAEVERALGAAATPERVRAELVRMRAAGSGGVAEFTDLPARRARLTAMMYWSDAARDVAFVDSVRREAAALFDGLGTVTVTGAVSINASVIDSILRSLVVCYLGGVFAIAALMIAAIGRVGLGLLAMVPNLVPAIFGLGLMGALGIPLNTYNLIGASIVIGVAVDDTIHFFHGYRRNLRRLGSVRAAVRATLGTAGRALLATTLILVVSFWTRRFSELQVIADFGLLVSSSLAVAFLADVLLAPALLALGRRPATASARAREEGVAAP